VKVNRSYDGAREDLIDLGLRYVHPQRVLDLGCYRGATGRALKLRLPEVRVVGVELDPQAAQAAQAALDTVFEGHLDEVLESESFAGQERFDLVLCGDILEHLPDPERSLRRVVERHLAPGGRVVISVPNIQYYETFLLLARGRWPRRERGIFDRTHLRFFTRRELLSMLEACGLKVDELEREFRLAEGLHPLNRLTRFVRPLLGLAAGLFTFQLRVVAHVR
tara:strand:- start:2088 stop:2753 length:666 start_codon:yes stop_codon:yes gene_type:complete